MTAFFPNTCAECGEPWGEEDGVFDTPVGAMCEQCYTAFAYAGEQEKAWAAQELGKYYDEGNWEEVWGADFTQ